MNKLENIFCVSFLKIGNQPPAQSTFIFHRCSSLSLLAKSKYEKNVYAILKVAYQGTITTKNFARPLLLKV